MGLPMMASISVPILNANAILMAGDDTGLPCAPLGQELRTKS